MLVSRTCLVCAQLKLFLLSSSSSSLPFLGTCTGKCCHFFFALYFFQVTEDAMRLWREHSLSLSHLIIAKVNRCENVLSPGMRHVSRSLCSRRVHTQTAMKLCARDVCYFLWVYSSDRICSKKRSIYFPCTRAHTVTVSGSNGETQGCCSSLFFGRLVSEQEERKKFLCPLFYFVLVLSHLQLFQLSILLRVLLKQTIKAISDFLFSDEDG